ncbi:MAG: M48 family metalloprotease [Odoribacter sp.]|nr:M48 family metalloprotease [Odoribacter sp.]
MRHSSTVCTYRDISTHTTITIRHIATSLLILCTIFQAPGRDIEKHYTKIIENYDVADTVMHAPDATSFWKLLQATDASYHKTARSLSRENKHRDIKRDMTSLLYSANRYFAEVPVDGTLYRLTESIVNSSGLRGLMPTASLTITNESDIALFSYPNAYFFITRPLYDLTGGDSIAILAFTAAEGTHYALQHAYANACKAKAKARRSRIGRLFGAAAIIAAGVILDQATDSWWAPFTSIASTVAMTMVALDSTPRYTFNYSAEQIYQADIVAYRFMEWCGYGGKTYISALRATGFHIDATMGNPDSPSVTDRLALLEYIDSHPELRNKVKASRRRLRHPDDCLNAFVI